MDMGLNDISSRTSHVPELLRIVIWSNELDAIRTKLVAHDDCCHATINLYFFNERLHVAKTSESTNSTLSSRSARECGEGVAEAKHEGR